MYDVSLVARASVVQLDRRSAIAKLDGAERRLCDEVSARI